MEQGESMNSTKWKGNKNPDCVAFFLPLGSSRQLGWLKEEWMRNEWTKKEQNIINNKI